MGNQPGKAAEFGKHLSKAASDARLHAAEAAKAAAISAQRAALAVERQGGLPPRLGDRPHEASHDDTEPLQIPRYVELPKVFGDQRQQQGNTNSSGSSNNGVDSDRSKELDTRPSFSTASASQDKSQREMEELYKRVNERPASFRRLDDPEEGPMAQVDVNTIDASTSELELSKDGRSTVPLDPETAEAAASVQQASGEQVSVMKLRPSSMGALTPEEKAALHEKNARTVANVESLDGMIVTRPGDDRGRASVAMWEAMQLNPKLLDSAEALQRSHAQMLLAQMALGYIPPEARADLSPAQIEEARKKAPQQLMLSDGSRKDKSTDLTASVEAKPQDGFVPLAERIDSLVPAGTTLDQLILSQPIPTGVTAWGPRPIEGSPYDQLILHDPDEPLMLDRNKMFEMYARHRSDPDYWTPERLASYYDTSEWEHVRSESSTVAKGLLKQSLLDQL